jgi:putative transposase
MEEKHMAKTTPDFPPELLDALLAGEDPKTVLSSRGLTGRLKKALAERMLNAELDHHLAQPEEEASGNHKNGSSSKTVLTEDEKLRLKIPRDREGRFEPALIAKYQRRLPGFDDKVIAMYARGMTMREIRATLLDLYGLEVSPELISTITDAVMEEVKAWQMRPLERLYAFVFFDALRVKIRDEGTVQNKAVYIAMGYRYSGHKEILGIWIEQTEGAKFWLRVMNELKSRGLDDILVAVIDGLKGFPEAIEAVFPQTRIQTCIVHLLRYSMQFVSWKDRKALAAALKRIYQAPTADVAHQELEDFTHGPWGQKFPMIAESWKRNWEHIIPFFSFPDIVRKIIYTTNAIESLNGRVRKAVQLRGHFPNDEAAMKLIWLVLRNVARKWNSPPVYWRQVKIQLAIQFKERVADVH